MGDHPAAERDALAEQAGQFVAPDFAVAWEKIERMAADADFQDFALVTQLLFERVFRHLHFGQS